MSNSLRKGWRPLARSSCWLFFPFTSASVHDDQDDKDKDAPLQSSRHNRHHATTTTGNTEASPDPGQSTWSPSLPLSPPLPVELDTNAATIALAFLLGSAATLGASTVYRRFFKRIRSAEWITPDLLGRKRWITGVVTRSVCHLP